MGAYNITPSPERDRGNGLEIQPGIELSRRGDVIPNLPALSETFAFRAGRRSDSSPYLPVQEHSSLILQIS
ncbi:MAG: hypothetical protein DSO01_00480 [Archaeoglobi archaeon]|nr:MAG: hypothetical protein DSO01_00480 [Archaeoglobi archaeon]